MDKQSRKATISALQGSDAVWAREPKAKANLLANTLSSKCFLPKLVRNELYAHQQQRVTHVFVTVRSSHVAQVLKKIDTDSGTGPDGLASRVLKECAREMGLP